MQPVQQEKDIENDERQAFAGKEHIQLRQAAKQAATAITNEILRMEEGMSGIPSASSVEVEDNRLKAAMKLARAAEVMKAVAKSAGAASHVLADAANASLHKPVAGQADLKEDFQISGDALAMLERRSSISQTRHASAGSGGTNVVDADWHPKTVEEAAQHIVHLAAMSSVPAVPPSGTGNGSQEFAPRPLSAHEGFKQDSALALRKAIELAAAAGVTADFLTDAAAALGVIADEPTPSSNYVSPGVPIDQRRGAGADNQLEMVTPQKINQPWVKDQRRGAGADEQFERVTPQKINQPWVKDQRRGAGADEQFERVTPQKINQPWVKENLTDWELKKDQAVAQLMRDGLMVRTHVPSSSSTAADANGITVTKPPNTVKPVEHFDIGAMKATAGGANHQKVAGESSVAHIEEAAHSNTTAATTTSLSTTTSAPRPAKSTVSTPTDKASASHIESSTNESSSTRPPPPHRELTSMAKLILDKAAKILRVQRNMTVVFGMPASGPENEPDDRVLENDQFTAMQAYLRHIGITNPVIESFKAGTKDVSIRLMPMSKSATKAKPASLAAVTRVTATAGVVTSTPEPVAPTLAMTK
eukprot:TRINITY_DN27823_c2_g1_i1.p1 TRINITY_DN27823_c2_g1~~TRINITY_DN27823_c2_g1_i1.p1  ORF type:complete len:641 (+),score=139.36 TRINITY_DN27823_c2_g1_i1:154-1923(+)